MVRRAGAKPGDRIMVSGTIGDAALGLRLRKGRTGWNLSSPQRDHLLDRYLLPQPRVSLAEALRHHASAAMDVSDGLVGDLGKLCRVSGVQAEVDIAKVPLSDAVKAALATEPALIEAVLTGGDDYEIVCTVPPGRIEAFHAAAAAARVPVTEIGRINAVKEPPRFLGRDGKPMLFKQASFSHF